MRDALVDRLQAQRFEPSALGDHAPVSKATTPLPNRTIDDDDVCMLERERWFRMRMNLG